MIHKEMLPDVKSRVKRTAAGGGELNGNSSLIFAHLQPLSAGWIDFDSKSRLYLPLGQALSWLRALQGSCWFQFFMSLTVFP